MRRSLFALAVFAAAVLAAAAPAPTPAPPAAARPPLDFSGTWKLDENASVRVAPNMRGAVLVVEQLGDRIRISPAPQGPGKLNLSADEIVADGRPYEKSVGGAKGVVTARWSADGKSLQIEATAEPPEKTRKAVQLSRWSLSPDKAVWVRETHTLSGGKTAVTRLLFRRFVPEPAATSTPAPVRKRASKLVPRALAFAGY